VGEVVYRERARDILHPTLYRIFNVLNSLGLKVFIIGARSILIHGVDLGRETRDWDIAIDKSFTPELRDKITRLLRNMGFKVQWRKWGFLVSNDVHVDINYAPLILDEEFINRSRVIEESVYVPCLEDIIVLKLMSSEKKDIADLKRVLHQSWGRLDKDYLYMRVKQTGLEREFNRLLKRLGLK